MAYSGRLLLIAHEATPGGGTYTTIAGLQNTVLKCNGAIVDVTSKDDAGVRQLLNAKVLNSVSVTGDGVAQDSATLKFLRDTWAAGVHVNFRITTGGDSTAGVTYTGAFVITSFEETGAHDGEQRYSVALESGGTVTIAALT